MEQDKTIFINKIIAKVILLMIWVALATGNMLCIQKMYATDFYNWLILSLVTFFGIIFLIDPLLYLILVFQMIKNKEARSIYYYSRRIKKINCSNIFIVFLIGQEKMRDLRRKLNPIITTSK